MLQTGVLKLGEGKNEPVYLAGYYRAEQECAMLLKQLCQAELAPLRTEVADGIERRQKSSGIRLATQQRAAIETAVAPPGSIINGGAGAGEKPHVPVCFCPFCEARVGSGGERPAGAARASADGPLRGAGEEWGVMGPGERDSQKSDAGRGIRGEGGEETSVGPARPAPASEEEESP